MSSFLGGIDLRLNPILILKTGKQVIMGNANFMVVQSPSLPSLRSFKLCLGWESIYPVEFSNPASTPITRRYFESDSSRDDQGCDNIDQRPEIAVLMGRFNLYCARR